MNADLSNPASTQAAIRSLPGVGGAGVDGAFACKVFPHVRATRVARVLRIA